MGIYKRLGIRSTGWCATAERDGTGKLPAFSALHDRGIVGLDNAYIACRPWLELEGTCWNVEIRVHYRGGVSFGSSISS